MSSPISTRYTDHLFVGLALGLWLYLFLAIIGPFDAAPLPLRIRMFLMVGYGLVFCVVYVACIPLQNAWHTHRKTWSWLDEIVFLLLFSIISLPACYRYYITDAVNGDWGFRRFSLEIFLPTIIILLPLLAFARWIVARRRHTSTQPQAPPLPQLLLQGDNKHDVLRIRTQELLLISAANNYVEIHYLVDGELQKKLLRTTLKRLHTDVPDLVRVHRSHLVNPEHFREWTDPGHLQIGSIQVPVSKTYKAQLLAQGLFIPK